MTKVNVSEAKTRFSAYLERVANGETIIVCRHNVPIAELRPVKAAPKKPRPLGLGAGTVQIRDAFFEPLPEDLAAAFELGT